MRDLLARYCDPHLQRPTINRQTSVCQNLIKKVVTSVILRSKLAAMAVVHQKPHQSRQLAPVCSKPFCFNMLVWLVSIIAPFFLAFYSKGPPC